MQKMFAILNSGGDSPGMNAATAIAADFAELYGMRALGGRRGYNAIIHRDEAFLADFFAHAERVVEPSDRALLAELKDAVYRVESGTQMPNFEPLFDKYREAFLMVDSWEDAIARYPSFAEHFDELSVATRVDISGRTASYLHSARCEDFKIHRRKRLIAAINLLGLGIRGLIIIGGDGSYNGARKLVALGIHCICIPGTIDNDLVYSEMSLGFDTAINTCVECVREIRASFAAHDRPIVVETMGNECGYLAMRTKIATRSEILLVGERAWSLPQIVKLFKKQLDRGNTSCCIIASEGAWGAMNPKEEAEAIAFLRVEAQKEEEREAAKNREKGLDKPPKARVAMIPDKMNASMFALYLRYLLKVEARASILGYVQRGGLPSAFDSTFAYEAGKMAVELLRDGYEDRAVGYRYGRTFEMPLEEALTMQDHKQDFFDEALYALATSI